MLPQGWTIKDIIGLIHLKDIGTEWVRFPSSLPLTGLTPLSPSYPVPGHRERRLLGPGARLHRGRPPGDPLGSLILS